MIWLYLSSICMAMSHGGEEEDSLPGNPECYLRLQLPRSPESLASPHPQADSESRAPVYIGWTNLHFRANERAQPGLLVAWVTLTWFSPLRHLLASLMTCVKSLQERAAMEDQGSINRVGPLRIQSISGIHAKKISQQQKTMPASFVRTRDREFSTDNKTHDIRHSCPLLKCQSLTWGIGSLVVMLAGAGTLCSALGGQVWRLCF